MGRVVASESGVEAPVIDDDAAEHGAVPGQELRRGMDRDRRAVLERAQQCRRRQRVVDDQWDRVLIADVADGADVEHIVAGVGERLGEQRAGVRADRRPPGIRIGDVVDERGLDVESSEVV